MENEFGKKIRTIRKEKGLTQQEFADELGYAHKSTINKIESGQEDMSYQKILVLLRKFMIDSSELFGENNEEDIHRLDEMIEESKIPQHNSSIVYIHGLYGNHRESDFYSFFSKKHDVIGLDYQDGNPWEVKEKIIKEFSEIYSKYKTVYVIANSIGAFYTYMYLSDFRIAKAFFISPLVNMRQVIEKTAKSHKITIEQLKEERIITLEDGQVLSYDFYESLSSKDNWSAKTHILYGEKDKLVDKESIYKFVVNHNASLTIMKNGEHYFHTPGQLKYIRKWINEYF